MALYKYVVWGGSEEGLLVKVSIKLEIPLKTVERHITAMKKIVRKKNALYKYVVTLCYYIERLLFMTWSDLKKIKIEDLVKF